MIKRDEMVVGDEMWEDVKSFDAYSVFWTRLPMRTCFARI